MKVSRWTLLWLLIVGTLIAIELAIVFGVVNPYDVGPPLGEPLRAALPPAAP